MAEGIAPGIHLTCILIHSPIVAKNPSNIPTNVNGEMSVVVGGEKRRVG